jgi:osmoprotectant transport system ATP-binding protein
MIVAARVSKFYGQKKAVDEISFEVKEGENLVLLGTSGCGKTTTLKMINRLIPHSSGKISVNGADINSQPEETLRRNIGYVLQHSSLFPHYTVAENIAVVPKLLKWDHKRITSRTDELVHKLNLSPDYLQSYPHELSGGQQQRVNIARALAANPPVLLMDEPFGALDAITRAGIVKEFSELDEFKRKTIILVTHDVKEAFLLADRICMMNGGKIVQQGSPADLLFHPASDFVKDFLSGSYLQLALSALSIKDFWTDLQDAAPGNDSDAPLADTSSLWELLEQSIRQKVDAVVVADGQGARKQVRKNDIFKALER